MNAGSQADKVMLQARILNHNLQHIKHAGSGIINPSSGLVISSFLAGPLHSHYCRIRAPQLERYRPYRLSRMTAFGQLLSASTTPAGGSP
jgi:hypothetical protein